MQNLDPSVITSMAEKMAFPKALKMLYLRIVDDLTLMSYNPTAN